MYLWSVVLRSALCLLLLCHGRIASAEIKPYALLWVESHSDAFPVHDLVWGMGRDFRTGEQHLGFGRAEVGVRYGNLSVGALYRYEVSARSSRSASELIWRSETGRAIPAGRRWPLRLDVNQVLMRGVALGYTFFPAPNLTLTTRLQLLNATEMIDGQVSGDIETYDDDYQGQAHLTYFYTRDSLWDRPTGRRRGQGAALDLHAVWQINPRHRLRLHLLDGLNGIYWRDMYYTTADLTSDRVAYDDDGQLNVRAAMTGYEGNRHHWQRLPVKAFLHWQATLAQRYTLGAELVWIDRYQDVRLYYYPARWPGLYVSATRHGSVGLGYRAGRLSTALQMDDTPHQARAVSLSFSWQTPGL
ncbi:hypothetical protein [Alcanivorax sp. S71-1-4]|uniref:hypothetical protein n=1 Tax=Alcanivorax sp. S71-1-4 TaxID=1177159 RepID=UPI0013581893|nr:hypothetical protein [Alcanivorax sp. S71-1-4]